MLDRQRCPPGIGAQRCIPGGCIERGRVCPCTKKEGKKERFTPLGVDGTCNTFFCPPGVGARGHLPGVCVQVQVQVCVGANPPPHTLFRRLQAAPPSLCRAWHSPTAMVTCTACSTHTHSPCAARPLPPHSVQVQTKPHGHGDVHGLLHSSGLAAKWQQGGFKWVCFFQVTTWGTGPRNRQRGEGGTAA